MERVAEFYKVSCEQFFKDIGIVGNSSKFLKEATEMYNKITLPKRSTSGSAGYDFVCPFDVLLKPGETIKIPTGIRVRIKDGWFLMCAPRSSLGFKYRLQLDNTLGVVDSDYFFSENEGHIFAKITNDSKNDLYLPINTGDRFMQGIFLPYGITVSDDATTVRNGGIGSTGN